MLNYPIWLALIITQYMQGSLPVLQLLHLHGVYVLDINAAANYTQFTQGTPRGILYEQRNTHLLL